MKTLCFSIIFLSLVCTLGAQNTGEVTIPLTKPGEIGYLVVDVRQGSIEVKGTNRQDVLVRYSKLADEHCDDCDEVTKGGLKRLKNNNLDLDITEDKNRIKVNSDSWNNGADLYIEIPQKFNVSLDSYLGDLVSLTGVSGELSLEGYTGDIYGSNLVGFISASTYSGSIKIDIKQITSDKPMAFSNYSGDIDLTFPAGFKSDLKLQTRWGDVFSAYDLVVDKTEPELKKVEGEKRFKLATDNWIHGKINGGGPETVIKSQSGNIYLRKAGSL